MSKFLRQKMSRPNGGLESPNWLILSWVAYHRRTEKAFGLVHVEVWQWGSTKFIIFHTYVQWISKRNCICKIDRINTEGMIQDSRIVWYQTILNVLLSNLKNINRTKSQNLSVSRLVLQLSLPNSLNKVLGREWCWSSAHRWCSNYIWVINNFAP